MSISKESLAQRMAQQLPPEPVSLSSKHPAGSQAEPVNLRDLLEIHQDERFILEAYRKILGRECDPSGYVHYLQMLQSGVSRMVVARTLLNSEEARGRGVQVVGSPAGAGPGTGRIPLNKRLRLGLLGRARELVKSVFHQPLEAVERRIEFRLQELQDGQARSEDRLEGLVQEMRRELRELSFRRQVVFSGGQNVLVTEVEGLIVGVPGEEWRMAAYLALRGAMEPGLTKLFCGTVKPGMTVLDVGANFGWYTLNAARLVGGTGRVIALEPTPRTFSILKDNVQVNGFLESRIIDLRQVAAGDCDSEQILWTFADNSGHNTFGQPEGPAQAVKVPVRRLDSIVPEGPVDVVKIDVEGWEPQVLAGMKGLLSRNPEVKVFMEFAPSLLKRAGHDPCDFLAELSRHGFERWLVNEENGQPRSASDSELLAVHSANLMLVGENGRNGSAS